MDQALFIPLLNAIKDPLVFVDTDHIIRFMNKSAIENYSKWGGEELIGKSLLDCHNETSCANIHEVFAAMLNGEDERFISENQRRRVYMRAVRAEDGALLGYYERYEWLL